MEYDLCRDRKKETFKNLLMLKWCHRTCYKRNERSSKTKISPSSIWSLTTPINEPWLKNYKNPKIDHINTENHHFVIFIEIDTKMLAKIQNKPEIFSVFRNEIFCVMRVFLKGYLRYDVCYEEVWGIKLQFNNVFCCAIIARCWWFKSLKGVQ